MIKNFFKLFIVTTFLFFQLPAFPLAQAQEFLNLPEPGTMVPLSPSYEPAIIKGVTVHKDNPFLFDFIVDAGQDHLAGGALKKESEKLIRYFLASLAISEKDLWVNLSPYEKDRIIPSAFGQTDMGRDLLAQDYILKQITASLIYPEKGLGKTFWDRVYTKARQVYGTTQIPINTFNKVWIMADKAEVFEHGQTAFVVSSHLKVMLEEDYLSLQKHAPLTACHNVHSIGADIVRDIVLPELEKEVNTGRNFANLRQITNSLILASWYKNNLKQALFNQVYADKEKIKGINLKDSHSKEQIYERYLQAYKKGVFNFIKEESTGVQGQTIPRKYFSGGWDSAMASKPKILDKWPWPQIGTHLGGLFRVSTDFILRNMETITPIYLLSMTVVIVMIGVSNIRDHHQVTWELANLESVPTEKTTPILQRISLKHVDPEDIIILGEKIENGQDNLYVKVIGNMMKLKKIRERLNFGDEAAVHVVNPDHWQGWEEPWHFLGSKEEDMIIDLGEVIKFSLPVADKKPAGNAMNEPPRGPATKGGIDLNGERIDWNIRKEGKGIEINIDPAMVKRIKQEGFDSLTPEIYSITPVGNIWPLTGEKLD